MGVIRVARSCTRKRQDRCYGTRAADGRAEPCAPCRPRLSATSSALPVVMSTIVRPRQPRLTLLAACWIRRTTRRRDRTGAGMSAVIWAIFNFRAWCCVCHHKRLDRFTFQLRRTIGTATVEIVFGLYYSAGRPHAILCGRSLNVVSQVLSSPSGTQCVANGMTNDQIVSNDQDVGFCATSPSLPRLLQLLAIGRAGVRSGRSAGGVLVAANFVVVIGFTWFVLPPPPA